MDMDPTNPPPDDGDGADDNNDAYLASLLEELNETRKELREKDSLLNETQERLTTLEEKLEQLSAVNTAEDDEACKTHPVSPPVHRIMNGGLDHELTISVGTDSVATYEHYINAQRNLRFGGRSSALSSVASTNFRSKSEIEVIQNIARRTNSAEWDAILQDLDRNDENGHGGINDHKSMPPFYSPPVQRQRYGDDKVLPHVGWGDLFFDLFYVGAAYNL